VVQLLKCFFRVFLSASIFSQLEPALLYPLLRQSASIIQNDNTVFPLCVRNVVKDLELYRFPYHQLP